jgi:ABC-type uncharacterized transport system substrate-binding protein
MRLPLLLLAGVLLAAPVSAHPHEWVDWGAGLVIDEKKPSTVVSVQLELTWDEWFSALMLTDFPMVGKTTLGTNDLAQLDTTYGLGSPNRASSLTVTWRGQAVPVKLTMRAPRSDGKRVTLVYSLVLNKKITSPSELRICLYDPTYYTDMGIRAKNGAFFLGVKDTRDYDGASSYEQDLAHPYYGGAVFPEVVVFALKP